VTATTSKQRINCEIKDSALLHISLLNVAYNDQHYVVTLSGNQRSILQKLGNVLEANVTINFVKGTQLVARSERGNAIQTFIYKKTTS